MKRRLFQGFKYSVYALLTINMLGFFYESLAASEVTFKQGIPVTELINAFTGALDSAAWIVLLLFFELETFVIPDDRLRGGLKWLLHLGRVSCYAVIVYALTGYVNKTTVVYSFEPAGAVDACSQLAGEFSVAARLDEYTLLDAGNCRELAQADLFLNPHIKVFSDAQTLSVMKRMAWTDVVNAAVWILIVIVLELEVYLFSSRLFGSRVYIAYKSGKLLLYGTLLVAAVYWWAFGDFLDFWDAVLWLVAFFFIEMNVIQWQEDRHEAEQAPDTAGHA